MPFSEFCDYVFKNTSVKIYYHEKWVDKLNVTLDADSITAVDAVTKALKASGLEVSLWHGDIIVLPGEKLLESLPNYKENKAVAPDTVSNALTESEERYIIGRQADAVQTLRVGLKGGPMTGAKAKIQGRIVVEETGEPILFATIYIMETQSAHVSDVNGFVSLMLKPGVYTIIFECLGYGKKKYQIEVLSDGIFSVTMKQTIIQMTEVIVYGDRQNNIQSKDPGLDKISMKAIRELPMMMGENDILKVSGTLPGIVSVGEGSAGLNVRGGGSDQNAFYINKIPIYNTSHLFGFFPAFNSGIIKDLSIYKGYIPSQYGGHLSSVFNIISRQGNRKNYMTHGGISPVTASLVVEGPLKKDTSSFLLSARSSYSDWILKKLSDPDIRNSSAGFNDFSGSVNYDIKKTQLSLFGYHSFDSFRLSDLNSYEYSNNGLSLSINHNFTNSIRSEFSFIASEYKFSTIDQQEISNAYQQYYNMHHYEARADFKHMVNDKNELEYGASVILYKLDRGTVIPYGDKSLRNPVDLGKEQGLESALYISDNYNVLQWLNVTVGARYALYTPLGAKTVFEYAAGTPKDVRYIIDTLSFGKNKPIINYKEPDLRLAININTGTLGSVKLAFNRMHQNLFMLSNTITIAPNTQWKLADYHILPSESNQVSAGLFRTFAEAGIESSAELFYKKTKNFTEFKDGADFLNNPQVETSVLQGNQAAWGIEVYMKRSSRKLSGWISYTYSRSLIQVSGEKYWNQINGGITYPANFDIPHVLNVVFNYHITRRIVFASILTYQAGKPVTYPVSVYYIGGLPTLDYSKRNAYRIPDYMRADLSLTIEGNLKKQKLVHSSLIFSLYNATGRDNPYSVYFKTEDGVLRSYQYSVISVPIFTITWLFKFGNYASE